MRKFSGSPPDPEKDITPKQRTEIITQVREYELITPLYGGGVKPTEADPVTVVRATEVRGHLRFWWRACRSGQYGSNPTAIKQAEGELWGSASTEQGGGPSQVQIEITDFSVEDRNLYYTHAPTYVIFPLRQAPHKTFYNGVSFTLTISFPVARKKDIEATLRMWEIFGGIGARTRRGFGALHLVSVDEAPNVDLPLSTKEDVKVWIKDQLKLFVVDGTYPSGMSHLQSTTLFRITDPSEKTIVAWDNLIQKLASFRQNRRGPRGRSYWPEPEAIREITGDRYTKHSALNYPRKFPRAAFGLPIIFHFKYIDEGEPEDTTLQGAQEGKERFASPLILRPLLCKDNQTVGLALLLEGSRIPPPGGIILDYDPTTTVDTLLTPAEAKAIPVLHGETDVLQAFMTSLK